ncbi:MAG: glycosyltransferase [Rhodospirillales bacterium]|nr:glycosyltransferase [Rhodospirillales bacterium]
MPHLALTGPDPGGIRRAALPAELAGQWCRVRLRLPRHAGRAGLARLRFTGSAGLHQETFPHRPPFCPRATALVLIPPGTETVALEWLGGAPEGETGLELLPCSRRHAALHLGLRHPWRIAVTLAGAVAGGPAGMMRRLRAGIAALAEADAPASYRRWIALFDRWDNRRRMALAAAPDRADWPGIAALFFACDPASAAARASRAALDGQTIAVATRRIAPGETLPGAWPANIGYIALVQAGEVLAPHALGLLAAHAARLGRPAFLYADEDRLSRRGRRHAPLFKPEPGRALMLSGTLARGVWLVRRDVLAAMPAVLARAPWAEAIRLDLWLRAQAAGLGAGRRVPFVLTHRRADAEAAPTAILARVIAEEAARSESALRIAAGPWPLRVSPAPRGAARVNLIVPSALRGHHVARCLSGVLERTEGVSFDLRLVRSAVAPPDAAERRLLARLGADPRVAVEPVPMAVFDYAAANNAAAARCDAPFLCLLNDDVLPLRPHWLAAMLGEMADPGVAIVGARLFYPDRRTQHGGVLMGVGGISDHMNRFLPRRAPGYAHRGVLSQDVSAVTGACLLIRRDVFVALGGLDPGFPVLHNDVDLCLRARKAGHRVVVAAAAELLHYESLSLGHHFAGARAGQEAAEAARMQARHAEVIAADPFHNPNLSQRRGQEWRLAFPPRLAADLPA